MVLHNSWLYLVINTRMEIKDLYIYLDALPDSPEKDAIEKVLEFFDSVKDKAEAVKRFDEAMKGVF